MLQPLACPDENELVRFARGALDASTSQRLVAHLDACGTCRRGAAEAASERPLSAPGSPGALRVGRYEIEGLLGAGAMGAVYAARDTSLHRRVAIKLLHAATSDDSNARLDREAQAMARLNHPCVVTVYELGDWAGGHFIAMELVEGTTLDQWAPRASLAERRRALLDAGSGLAAAHQAGVVHRDFKPHNLLVGSDGHVRVTDFGLARPLPSGDSAWGGLLTTQRGALVGTPAWMSPEQLEGRVADARSDQFAFCVVWVETLTQVRPFVGNSQTALLLAMTEPPALGRALSAGERRAMTRGLSTDPARRFESMDALLAALCDDRPRRWPIFLVTALLLLSAAVTWHWLEAPRPTPALTVGVSQRAPISVPCIRRLAIGDPEVADIAADGVPSVIGRQPGETTLLVWDCVGGKHDFTVRVEGP